MDHLGTANNHLAGSQQHITFTSRWCALMDKRGKVDSSSLLSSSSSSLRQLQASQLLLLFRSRISRLKLLTVQQQMACTAAEPILQVSQIMMVLVDLQNPLFSYLISYLLHCYTSQEQSILSVHLPLSYETPQLTGSERKMSFFKLLKSNERYKCSISELIQPCITVQSVQPFSSNLINRDCYVLFEGKKHYTQ